MNQITDAQRRALNEVREFVASRKYPPTMKELGTLLGVSAASAHQLVAQLERKGYVNRQPRQARSLAVLREPEQTLDSLVSVPLVGVVKAGPAMLAEENVLGHVFVAKSVVGRGKCFGLTISGDSMRDAGINEGDVVIVRQQPVADSGEVVVALIGDDATVKRLFYHDDRVELRPQNRRYRPIVVGPDDEMRILGKVVAVRRADDVTET